MPKCRRRLPLLGMPSLQTNISPQSSTPNSLTSHQRCLSSQSCCLKTKLSLQDKRFNNKAKTHHRRTLFIPSLPASSQHRKILFSSPIYTATRSWCSFLDHSCEAIFAVLTLPQVSIISLRNPNSSLPACNAHHCELNMA